MSDLLASSGDALGRVPSGYGERHVRKGWFGTGEARLPSLVSKDRSYKPVVKSNGGKRESDGVVIPLIAGMNPVGGKGPDFGHAGRGGKREGMAGTAQPNYPEGRHVAPGKVRQLQNRLWAAAKQSEGRRFHALYDRIHRADILWEAWERVRANRGAAGVDGLTLAAVEDYGVERMLDELSCDLRAGRYRPSPVRRVEIPKPDGSKRPLGIPTVVDRVAQQATKIVLEPLFEADCVPRMHRRDRCRRSSRHMQCCAGDGGRSSGVALQGEVPNHRKVRRSRAGVLSVAEKAGCQPVRCEPRRRAKANHPMTGRNRWDDIKTGVESVLRDEPGGNLLTAQVVSGLKVARARFRLRCGTWEPASRYDGRSIGSREWPPGRQSEIPKWQKPRGAE